MKKILAIAAAAALTCGVSAFAANPFSDVTPDDWAYQAVSDLSDQGIVEGYPDGTFKGQRNMTRYELAQIIARLMAREDQMNAEQRATVDKLASEYADELSNLGVRVGNLEKKVGNIYWSGDARMRYQTKDNTYKNGEQSKDNTYKNGEQSKDGWNGRMRINVKAQVNDSTYVKGRLTANMNFKDGKDSFDQNDGDVYMDQLYVNHQFGDFNVRLGRQPVTFGNQNGWLYGDSKGADAAQLGVASGKFTALAGYGRFNTTSDDNGYKRVRYSDLGYTEKDLDAFYAKAGYNWNQYSSFYGNYIHFTKDHKYDANGYRYGTQDNGDIWGVGTNIAFGNEGNWRAFGEYWNNSTANKYDKAYNGGLGYGHMNLKKPGTFALDVSYNNVERNVYFGGTGYESDVLSVLRHADKVRYWNAIGSVALQQNVYLHGEYAFDVNSTHNTHGDHDAWTVSLNYVF